MARTDLTPQDVTLTGLNPTFTAANVDGHRVVAPHGVWVHVKNDDASPITVTLPTPGTVEGLAVDDRTVTVPAGGERLFKASDAVRDLSGAMLVDFSSVASVTVAAFRA